MDFIITPYRIATEPFLIINKSKENTMSIKKILAIANHDKGYNCCQSVTCAFSKEIGVDETTMFKAGEGFGLGMGGMDGPCGALMGAVILAGFQNSTANLDGTKSKFITHQKSKELVNAFVSKNGSMQCKELKGIETGTILRSCSGCIVDATELVETILNLK